MRAAEADATLRNREAILRACREIESAMEPRVGRVTVRVTAAAPRGLAVRVNGTALAAALVGVPYPVAPGVVRVQVSAEGFVPYDGSAQVAAGQTTPVKVTLTLSAVDAPPPPPPPSPPPPPPPPPPSGPGVGPWIVVGAGAVSLALSGVFYGLSSGARGDRDAACSPDGCDPAARSLDDRYATFLTATNVALGVGAAAVVGGATWYLIARLSQPGAAPRTSLRIDVTPRAEGLSLGVGGRL